MTARRIAVFTGTRAEYGLLYWLMKGIVESDLLDLQVIAAAMHLSPEFGETWREIASDGFEINARIEMLVSSDTRTGVIKSMGLGLIGIADALERLKPDALVVLGDRFEALVAAQSALIMGVPLVHIHGGEITEGAYDDAIRHAISKMAVVHFTATEDYRRRVIQLGEDPDYVFDVGALGLEHIVRSEPMRWPEVEDSLGLELRGPLILATYHAATSVLEEPVDTARAMLASLGELTDYKLILTYSNADNGGRAINAAIKEFAAARPGSVVAVPSLGFRRYIAVLRHATLVIGNSSSGIIEVPSFGIPTVNVGERQRGRISARSVIHCTADRAGISDAIARALKPDHLAICRNVTNPYGSGRVSSRMIEVLETIDLRVAKRFRDLDQAQ